jgi:hypothetical protein
MVPLRACIEKLTSTWRDTSNSPVDIDLREKLLLSHRVGNGLLAIPSDWIRDITCHGMPQGLEDYELWTEVDIEGTCVVDVMFNCTLMGF